MDVLKKLNTKMLVYKMKKQTEKQRKVIKETTFFTICKNCGHTRDWHHIGDILFSHLFGIKLGECYYYERDETLPFWKRKRIYCKCKKFKK